MIKNKLEQLGLELPSPSVPGGNYTSFHIRGSIAYVAIQFPIQSGEYLYQGRLGQDLDTEDGYQAMQLCALNVLAQINQYTTVNQIEGLNHIDAYYQSTESWDEAPLIVNGASDLFVNVLGDKGIHTRSIVGVHTLPRGFSVGLSASLTLRKPGRGWVWL